jgi:hypothetical protein
MNDRWLENFRRDAREALDNFTVITVRHFADGGGSVHAEAKTGSKYVMYAVPAVPGEGADYVLIVASPWTAVWPCSEEPYLHPNYFVEHWGAEHRGHDITRHHGGDLYALMRCATELVDASWPSPEELG